jgi:hypothetical protein
VKGFLKGVGHLLLLWLAIIALVGATAVVLAVTDPMKGVPYVGVRGGA